MSGSYTGYRKLRRCLSRPSGLFYRSPPSEDDHIYPGALLELDGASATRFPTTEFSREYAIKLLSKTDLDEELVARPHRCVPHLIHSLQVLSNDFQVTRQPIPAHPNIVSLYCTLETSAYLLIFFSGQELFYFLE